MLRLVAKRRAWRTSRRGPRTAFFVIRRWPIIPGGVLAVMVICAIFAPWIAPQGPYENELRDRLVPPAWTPEGQPRYLLGTDHIGRDILSRIIHGARVSAVVISIATGVGVTVGTILGIIAGYFGRHVDEVIMRSRGYVGRLAVHHGRPRGGAGHGPVVRSAGGAARPAVVAWSSKAGQGGSPQLAVQGLRGHGQGRRRIGAQDHVQAHVAERVERGPGHRDFADGRHHSHRGHSEFPGGWNSSRLRPPGAP